MNDIAPAPALTPDPALKADTVSFGYEDIPATEKTARVGGVFSNVASKYDLMNDAMSAACTGCGRTASSAA